MLPQKCGAFNLQMLFPRRFDNRHNFRLFLAINKLADSSTLSHILCAAKYIWVSNYQHVWVNHCRRAPGGSAPTPSSMPQRKVLPATKCAGLFAGRAQSGTQSLSANARKERHTQPQQLASRGKEFAHTQDAVAGPQNAIMLLAVSTNE